MFKKLGLTAALAGVLLIGPAAFAQQSQPYERDRDGRAAGSRSFSEGRSFSQPPESGRAFSGERARWGAEYGRGYYAGPRVAEGVGPYVPAYRPYRLGYAAPCHRGYRGPAGYGARVYRERLPIHREAFARERRRPR